MQCPHDEVPLKKRAPRYHPRSVLKFPTSCQAAPCPELLAALPRLALRPSAAKVDGRANQKLALLVLLLVSAASAFNGANVSR